MAYPTYPGVCDASQRSLTKIATASNMGPNVNTTLDYVMASSAAEYGNTSITITIMGDGVFHGMLIYAANAVNSTSHLGTWSLTFNQSQLFQTMDKHNCSSFGYGSTIGHSSAIPKAFPVTFTWNPTPGKGNVNFWAVIVRGGRTGFRSIKLQNPILDSSTLYTNNSASTVVESNSRGGATGSATGNTTMSTSEAYLGRETMGVIFVAVLFGIVGFM
ncbi:hypothetical protein BDK51DRAFT_41134 [Blyttiomyces helicus]|uniref:Uncharacterized protein n=1 Tax=Blyttiomyces helicus TaxID=388810 RepID=A0A4P9W3T6_9FUNG|nr:hypothetical protein BDK51DRAFT_41134 [Blyttiomyces helicus]|eukprot:RKO86814.1 hypothetical protein BDK51DRAFT_41134 [Blyttiomyces helicus]